MAANTSPIFAAKGSITFSGAVTAANTAKDGTGTVNLIETAPVDGAFVQGIRFKSRGVNVASFVRVFITMNGDPTVAANNAMWDEIALPATALSEVAAQPVLYMPMNIVLPGTFRIYWALATAVAGGWQAMTVAGDYS